MGFFDFFKKKKYLLTVQVVKTSKTVSDNDAEGPIVTQSRHWKYFSNKEAYKLVPDLMYKLDRARGFYGYPIIITSGFRTKEKNEEIGGVVRSAHLTGQAVDIKAPDEQVLREKLSWALGKAGLERVFVYSRHFHTDCDLSKPYPAFGARQY